MKRKSFLICGIIYTIIALIITGFLLIRNEYGVFETKNSYFLCDEAITEYRASSLVKFDKKINDEKVDKEVYYFDENKNIKKDSLESFNQDEKVFTVNNSNYNYDNFLGIPSASFWGIGAIINFFTKKFVYLLFVIIPVTLLLGYEIYLLYLYIKNNKNKRELENEKK